MIFDRFRAQIKQAPTVGLTDGIEVKIAEFVKLWGNMQRGEREFTADSQREPLKLLTDADVALFTQSMEDEIVRVETYLMAEMNRAHNARVAQMDAEIAARNREIEAAKAKLEAQDAEVIRRGDRLAEVRQLAGKLTPGLATDGLVERDVVRKVVRLKMGDGAVAGMTEDQLNARFDILAANIPAPQDPFQRVMKDGARPALDAKQAADQAYADMVESLRNAHKETKH